MNPTDPTTDEGSRRHLRLLGGPSLECGGVVVESNLLSAHKRLALLAYLVLAEPRGFHRRDTLLAMLWPESDGAHARSALRNLIHLVRRDLGPGTIVARGDAELAIDETALGCDVNELRAALRTGRLERAVSLYRGPLLPAFYPPGASAEFEEWLDGERRSLAREVSRAALELSRRAGPSGGGEVARRWAARANEIRPGDAAVERWIGGLERELSDGPVPAPSASAALASAMPAERTAIAVLPFVALTPDAGTGYFADGMVEELIGLLGRVPGLRVVARSSSSTFRDSDAPVPSIACQLGVGTIVEGRVRRSGSLLRVGVNVFEASTAFTRWSGTFERAAGDAFALQDEVAAAIAEAVSTELNGRTVARRRRSTPTVRLEAYDLYLDGVYQLQERGVGPLRASIALLQRAIALDPAFAPAHSALASAWHALTFWAPDESASAGAQATIVAHRALALDDTLPDAHAVLAVQKVAERRWSDADAGFRHAIALGPNHPAPSHWYADFLQQTGRARESLVHARHALSLDPVSPVRNIVLAISLLLAGEVEEAREKRDLAYRLGLARDGFLPLAFALDDDASDAPLGDVLGLAALPTEADGAARCLIAMTSREARHPSRRVMLCEGAAALAALGVITAQQQFLLALLTEDHDRALAIGATFVERANWFMTGFWLRAAEGVRRHPAFEALLGRSTLPAYWSAHGHADALR